MALCGRVGATALPSELVVHIFSFLPRRDRLRASAACRRWRESLFHPSLWTQLRLRVGPDGANGSKLDFLMRRFGSFVRELELELDGNLGEPPAAGTEQLPGGRRRSDAMAAYLDQVLCVLTGIRSNRNLQKLSLCGDTVILQQDGPLDMSSLQGDKKITEVQQLFMELLSNSRQLRWLSCSFMLCVATPCSLSCLSNPAAETLQHLSLLDDQLGPLVSPSELDRLSNLRSLALEFCDFTSELCGLLASPRRSPLHRLSLLLNGAALQAAATEDDWKALVRVSANLRVYVMAVEADSSVLLRVLKPSLPLERLHLENYDTLVTHGVLQLVSQQYHKTLTHFLLVRDGPGLPDLSVNCNEDPLVLLAWRCKQLAVLKVHGYTMWFHNLVAISRLRGSSLRVLTVSEESLDLDPEQPYCVEGDPDQDLTKEVSKCLGRVWQPCLDSAVVLSEPIRLFHRELCAFSAGL